jgi:arsenite methyltransferase
MARLENECCTPQAQASCCEPADTASCCGEDHAAGCGCAADEAARTRLAEDVRETVREKYAAAARAAAEGSAVGRCSPADETGVFGAALYAGSDEAPETAVSASLGCGVPTAVGELRTGEVVLDLGSGAGADVLISARRVGPTGRAIGIDMTDEMLELARRNAADADVHNVEFRKGYLEDLPVADESVDAVISNCVINLSGDKAKVLAEAARVLRPGGRFAVSDVIADENMDDATRADVAASTGCIAGALTEREFRAALDTDVEVRETHRVHAHAAAAIIRARKRTVAFDFGLSEVRRFTSDCPK